MAQTVYETEISVAGVWPARDFDFTFLWPVESYFLCVTLLIVTNWNSFITDDSLYHVTVCGKQRYYLNSCSYRKPIRLISVRYVECSCTCDACEAVQVPVACVPRDLFNKILDRCDGSARCRLRGSNASCEFEYKTVIRITYACHTRNSN